MSDLTATNCGCGCEERNNNRCGFFGGNDCACSIIYLLIILSIFCGNGRWNGGDCDNNNSCLLILLLLFCCGGDNGFGGFC